MELKDYINILRKRIWIVIILTFAAGFVSALVSFFALEPVYQSTMSIYMIDGDRDYRLLSGYDEIVANRQLIRDCNEIIKSKAILNELINDLGLEGYTPQNMAKKINVGLKGDTSIIEIKVEDSHPERAKLIADKVSDIFIYKIVELMNVINVHIVDVAEIPDKPVRPNPTAIIALTMISGFFSSIVVVFLIEYFDDTIKTSQDVEKYLGLTVLASIPMLEVK